MRDVDTPPLISCIMPTHNRRNFVPAAIHYFLRQDYPNKELIIVDDGDDAVPDLIPTDRRIRYIRLHDRATVGAKRNLACSHTKGPFIAHWDDDDWHAPYRLSYQLESLQSKNASLCGLSSLVYYDTSSRRAWLYTYPTTTPASLACGTMCYRRSLWELRPFANVNIREDLLLSGCLRRGEIATLEDRAFYLARLHGENLNQEITRAAWWQPMPLESLRRQLGFDWAWFIDGHGDMPTQARGFRNVFACLVHENRECVVDLVRNLQYADPSSEILLYDGGTDSRLLADLDACADISARAHPAPHPMQWGWLHGFALESMRFAIDNVDFDTITIVDSDQLCVRTGYSRRLSEYFAANPNVGMLGTGATPQPRRTNIGPAAQAWKEVELWRPLLRRFPSGESLYPFWTFWPGTVFSLEAAKALVDLFDTDTLLAHIMAKTKIWASEEVILPTLTALIGFDIHKNPCSYDYVRYQEQCSDAELSEALRRSDVYWIHPVARRYDDRIRTIIRRWFGGYDRIPTRAHSMTYAKSEQNSPLLVLPILRRMRTIEGWFEEDEADLLMALVAQALRRSERPPVLVEVGSYCGRSTVVIASVAKGIRPDASIYAIDPHDGIVGAAGARLDHVAPSIQKFERNMREADVTSIVHPIVARSTDVTWQEPIDLLLIDGLHDYASVSQDFHHFARFVVDGGYVLFHDYAPYYPAVIKFVHECLEYHGYRSVAICGSLCALQRASTPAG